MPPSSLIWEDADISNAQSWWLARSRSEATDDARDFVSAEDPICNYLVGMVRSGSGGTYLVIAAAPLSEAVHLGDVVLTIKDQITTEKSRIIMQLHSYKMSGTLPDDPESPAASSGQWQTYH